MCRIRKKIEKAWTTPPIAPPSAPEKVIRIINYDGWVWDGPGGKMVSTWGEGIITHRKRECECEARSHITHPAERVCITHYQCQKTGVFFCVWAAFPVKSSGCERNFLTRCFGFLFREGVIKVASIEASWTKPISRENVLMVVLLLLHNRRRFGELMQYWLRLRWNISTGNSCSR